MKYEIRKPKLQYEQSEHQFLIAAYEKMFLIRRMEEELVKYYFANKVMSFVHFYVGQEAVAVGVCSNLEPGDNVLGNHRSHGHYLAKGGDPKAMVAELLGKETGCCRGKGGSMHMIDKSVNFIGSTPILGSVAPISAGSSLSQKILKSDNITVSFFGDGASEEGVVYETMNFATLMKLPLLLVIENNLYSVMTKLNERRGESYDVSKVANGIGIRYFHAAGNDFIDVFNKTRQAIEVIKNEKIPCVLECKVFRHMAHSAPITDDKIGYREIDTPENREKNDSVKNLRKFILSDASYLFYTESKLLELEDSVNKVVYDSIEFAVNSPLPNKKDLFTDVYYE
jgi:pyruvate dehydrogenase E1 component alpha subunit